MLVRFGWERWGWCRERVQTHFPTRVVMAAPTCGGADPDSGMRVRVPRTIWTPRPRCPLRAQGAPHLSSGRMPRSWGHAENRTAATPPPPHSHMSEAHSHVSRGEVWKHPISHYLSPAHMCARTPPQSVVGGWLHFPCLVTFSMSRSEYGYTIYL